MGISIQGWVEYNVGDKKEEFWCAWVRIAPIVKFNDEVNWVLMGNPRDFRNEKPDYKPIAKERGFPKNMSPYLEQDIEEINETLKEYPNEMIYGFTHLYFSEIINIDWKNEYQLETNDNWFDLFELIKLLMKLKTLESNQIRLTLWYCW